MSSSWRITVPCSARLPLGSSTRRSGAPPGVPACGSSCGRSCGSFPRGLAGAVRRVRVRAAA
ncbi:hypothetical protein ATKI12_1096 [Kitasatospora sp. Ki12]